MLPKCNEGYIILIGLKEYNQQKHTSELYFPAFALPVMYTGIIIIHLISNLKL